MTQSSTVSTKFLTVAEIAASMRVSKMTVYRLVHSGVIDSVRFGRSYRVPESALPMVTAALSSLRPNTQISGFVTEIMNSSDVTGGEDLDLPISLTFRRTMNDEDYAAAVEARGHVNTAVGIFMGKHDCTRHDALGSLQRTASTFDITLFELAKALIASSGS